MDDESTLTDEEIARRVQKGDTGAFGTLMARYEPKLLRYALRLLGNRDRAEEAVQEAFISAYRNIYAFNSNLRFSPWIYRIAHNQAVNEMRRSERAPISIDLDTLVAFSSDDAASDQAVQDETRRLVEAHLQKLAPHYREILVLFYFEELGYQEISDILHIPRSTVGVRLKRAKESLRTMLDTNL